MSYSVASLLYEQISKYRQFITYLFVGLFNTAVTLVIIYIMMYYNYYDVLCNVVGYTCGVIVSFILNSKLTFKATSNLIVACKFVVALVVAYLINLSIFILVRDSGVVSNYPYLIQISGMPFYVVSGYLLNKFWVFKD